MNIGTAREQIISTGKELLEKGLVARTWGNISCRVDDADSSYEGGSFVITASGKDYNTMEVSDTVEIGLKNFKFEGQVTPSMEYKIHGEVYKIRENAGFIIHTHQSSASAVSAMGLDVVQFKKEYKGIGNFVLCSEYGMAGSLRLYANVTKAVKESAGNAVIMKNHGAICFGETMEEAMETAMSLEEACSEFLIEMGVEPWDMDNWTFDTWMTDSVIEKYMSVRDSLPAYIDDYAMMVGADLKILDEVDDNEIDAASFEGRPLLVRGRGMFCTGEDKEAMAMVIDKNCRAALASLGVKPMDSFKCMIANRMYRKSYAKLK